MHVQTSYRMLYHCPEYYRAHGGRTHAREFFAALSRHPRVASADIVPTPLLQAPSSPAPPSLRRRVGGLAPAWMRYLLRALRARPCAHAALCAAVHGGAHDAVIIRLGDDASIVSTVRTACPSAIVCVEMNASVIAEADHLLFRRMLQHREAAHIGTAHVISVVSSYWKEYLEKMSVDPGKIVVNHNGFNPGVFNTRPLPDEREIQASLEIPPGSTVLGYVGGMEAFRRLPEVVDALANVFRRRENAPLFFLMVGDGADMPRVRARIAAHADVLRNRVVCAGRLPYEHIPAVIRTFDIALFPFSNPYGSPQKLFEYLACARPTIGPDVPATRDVFTHDEHLLLSPQNGPGFESLLEALLDGPEQGRRLAACGQRHVQDHYTWTHNADRLMQAIVGAHACASRQTG